MKIFYKNPTQLMFCSEFRGIGYQWAPGIAYKDEIIRAMDGKVFKIEDLIEAKEAGRRYMIYEYGEWNDIEEAVMGDILPEGLIKFWDGADIQEEE